MPRHVIFIKPIFLAFLYLPTPTAIVERNQKPSKTKPTLLLSFLVKNPRAAFIFIRMRHRDKTNSANCLEGQPILSKICETRADKPLVFFQAKTIFRILHWVSDDLPSGLVISSALTSM